MSDRRVQVGIVGAGPAGLALGRLLAQSGISFAIVERQSQAYVAARIRAGVLERASVALLDRAGAGARLHREGLVHEGVELAFAGRRVRIDFREYTGGAVTVYGQTEITRDLNALHAADGSQIYYSCANVALHGLQNQSARITAEHAGTKVDIACDYIAGCDGFHGISRATIPPAQKQEFERIYPVSWLGLLADTAPVSNELIYANHARGFALCSMRSLTRSRYYLQVANGELLDDWPDERFWHELGQRLPAATAAALMSGPAIDKSLAPLRSFVVEPMRFGRLFLAGDAAHIVPPTGAKGLNLAFADVAVLASAFATYFASGDASGLDAYSAVCLQRVWKVQRFSWWLTALTHRLDDDPFQQRLQTAELDYLSSSPAAMAAFAENYVGLP